MKKQSCFTNKKQYMFEFKLPEQFISTHLHVIKDVNMWKKQMLCMFYRI